MNGQWQSDTYKGHDSIKPSKRNKPCHLWQHVWSQKILCWIRQALKVKYRTVSFRVDPERVDLRKEDGRTSVRSQRPQSREETREKLLKVKGYKTLVRKGKEAQIVLTHLLQQGDHWSRVHHLITCLQLLVLKCSHTEVLLVLQIDHLPVSFLTITSTSE